MVSFVTVKVNTLSFCQVYKQLTIWCLH